jgi:hypothetical protein
MRSILETFLYYLRLLFQDPEATQHSGNRKDETMGSWQPREEDAEPEMAEGYVAPQETVEEVSEETADPGEVERKSNKEVAQEVIEGKWGVGQDRRRRLDEAGYNVDAVKAEVTRRLNSR